MPQDGLRSAIYRSFVTCDDPKGVVDCRTTRKSKTSSVKMEHKSHGRRKLKNPSSSLDNKKEKEKMPSESVTEEYQTHSPSSFQLREVSREAQKLNQTIDSWSKGLRVDGQSKDIAKDLLKGALDLQDSLVMLGKLQEASEYMAHLKKKQMEKAERRRKDEVGIGRTYSDHYRETNFMAGFQKPRLSADGSSRKSTEELKKVIKESLVRQNLLPNTPIHERACFPPRLLDSASETPSTSSSHSSSVHTTIHYVPAPAPTAPQQKTKGPNLIAKLMGLEEYPPKPLQPSPQRQFEDQRISSQRRPVFEIDRPKVRKPQSELWTANEERTLKEILETMQFKGLLRSNSGKELQPSFQHTNHSHFKEKVIDESPPIVLIRPLRVPCQEPKESHTPLFQEVEAFDRRKMLRKLRTKEQSTLKNTNHKDGALKSDRVHRKLKAEETPFKGLNEERVKEHEVEIYERPEEKEVSNREKASNKMKISSPVNYIPQKETIAKTAGKVEKEEDLTKPLEKNIVKTKHVPTPHEQDKMTSSKSRNHKNGSNIRKHRISQQSSTLPGGIAKHTTQSVSSNSTYQKKIRVKKEKLVQEPAASESVVSLLHYKFL